MKRQEDSRSVALAIHEAMPGNVEDLIRNIANIIDPVERYKSQQQILKQLMEAHDNVDDTIEDFYVYMRQDGAYKSKKSKQEFREKFAEAKIIMKSNRKRRDKRSKAIKKLQRRWGSEAISALVKSLGGNPSSTLVQSIRKLARKVQASEEILRINRAIYNKITTPRKGVRAIKKVTPSDVNKASGIPNPSPLTTKKQETIGMQISPLRLLTTGVIHELEPASDIGGPLHLGGPASEICTPKDSPTRPPSAKGSQHNVWDKQIDFRKRSKQVPPIANSEKNESEEGTETERPAKKRRQCECSSDEAAT